MFHPKAKGILFVKETGDVKTTSKPEVEFTPQQTLSGTEAKQFYEEVLSMPKELSASTGSRPKRKRKLSATKKRHQTRKRAKTLSTNTTVSQVFGYVQEGDLERLQTAISSGVCDVNTTDQFQWTLLMSAAAAGHTHLVEFLLSIGAEWRDRVDRSGQTAVDLARKSGHLSLACFIETYSETTTANGKTQEAHPRTSSKTYFCGVCQQMVTERAEETHSASTIHQFSCQHHVRPGSSYTISRSNRGYQMMLRSGWDPDRGLGCEREGRKYPVKTILKRDRLGFGQTDEKLAEGKAKVTHFAAFDERAVKRRPEGSGRGRFLRKKDIVTAARKDKEWEVRMRRYMNSEEHVLS